MEELSIHMEVFTTRQNTAACHPPLYNPNYQQHQQLQL